VAQVGWVPQLRPDTVGSPQGNKIEDFDWTGLDRDLYQTDGTHQHSTEYFGDGTYDAVELDLSDNAPGKSGSFNLTGTSTYKWMWKDPGGAQGVHNDPNKNTDDPTQPFPAPKLFAFGLTIPYVEGAYDEAAADPLTVMGNVKDGFDPNWTPKFDLLSSSYAAAPADSTDSNGNFINELPRRSILAGTLEGDHQTAHVTLSPGLHVEASTGQGYGDGYAYGYLEEGSSLIQLDYPNPYLRPDLGDFSGGAGESGNQFLYSADQQGKLSIPAQIGVPDAITTDDFDWLLKPTVGKVSIGTGPVVDWRFGAPQATLPGEQNYNITRQIDSSINQYVLAPDTMITTAAGKSVPGISFTGLPDSNDGFGTYPVTMTVNTYDPASKKTTPNDSQTAYIQTFFQGSASNFPGSKGPYTGDPTVQTAPPGTYSPPNWYNYYPQVDDVAGRYGLPVHYEAGAGTEKNASYILDDPANNYPVELHDDAYRPRTNVSVFDISPTLDPATKTHLVRHIGDLTVKGLFTFIYTLGHETGHYLTYTTPDDTQPGGGYIYRADIADLSPSWKQYHHLKMKEPDTTGAYGAYQGDATTPDAQLTADLNGVKELFAYSDSLQGALLPDWADGGWNYGSGTTLPYFVNERYNNDPASLISGKPPVFYFRFRPDTRVQPYGSGKPVLTADGNDYKIRSLADLRALYPNVVIGLEGLKYEEPVAPGP